MTTLPNEFVIVTHDNSQIKIIAEKLMGLGYNNSWGTVVGYTILDWSSDIPYVYDMEMDGVAESEIWDLEDSQILSFEKFIELADEDDRRQLDISLDCMGYENP